MKNKAIGFGLLLMVLGASLTTSGCKSEKVDAAAEAPPPAKVVEDFNATLFSVDHPENFPLAAAAEHRAPAKLAVTGVVNPDIARMVPVISLASGRIVGIYARLGDTVKKGQLLLKLRSDDISGGFANYQMAVADEILARAQYERAQDLFKHGAIALNDLQVAQDTEDKAKVAMDTAAEHLRLLGSNTDHPSGIVDITAPISGVITDQEVTNAAGVQSLGTSPFTISDLSTVWIVCDVYENDLPTVHVGDPAEITLNAYPGQVLKGTVSNILSILDPNLRTGKVRIEVRNPGFMKVGMFVTATFRGQKEEVNTAVPATAILHLHDRDWVYVPTPDKRFRRVMVAGGDALPSGLQEIKSGIQVGQQVVTNPLALQNEIDNR
ncbi:MAG TPA: efflux RND transporter periplasmic adaptor subunit [Terracidiphilus sp.]|jgi:cobalt-zinc-cadmium efflux system membrane fusion protein